MDREKEINWWKQKLDIDQKFKIRAVLEGNPNKKTYAPHGRIRIELSSVMHSAIIDNLMNLMKQNKL